jgi:Ca2+/H+ antiporter, TMEM165/GDT1 family
MEAFLVSIVTVAIAEMGDRTQLLTLVLAAHFRRPWPIFAGILVATLANHLAAGLIGASFARFLTPMVLDAAVGASMLGMAVWMLRQDSVGQDMAVTRHGAFVTTLVTFFLAEIGDKTQIATMALAAGYQNLPAVVGGTTSGMMIANIPVIFLTAVVTGTTSGMLLANLPVVFLGNAFAERLPLKALHYGAAILFAVIGAVFLVRAFAG